MKRPKVFIVCAVFNDIKSTVKLLNSIEKLTYKNIETIIIDDGSTDGTSQYIRKNFPNVKIIKGDGNLWWTGSIAKGVDYVLKNCSQNDYVLTINNDCTFDKNYLSKIIHFIKNETKVIVGSLAVDSKDGNIIDAGVKIDWPNAMFIALKPDIEKRNLITNYVDTLSTKGTLYPVNVFKEIGNFDYINFPHYLSDYEFACRAKKNGYHLVILYSAIVKNDGNRTGFQLDKKNNTTLKSVFGLIFSRKSKNNIVDQVRFFWKYTPLSYKVACYSAILKKGLFLISLIYPINLLRKIFIKDEK